MSQQLIHNNTGENQQFESQLSKSSNVDMKVLSVVNGMIYDQDARTVSRMDRNAALVDVHKFYQKKIKGASGDTEGAAKIDPFTDSYKGLLKEADRIEREGTIKGAASSGNNIIETPYELIRRVNNLVDVVGPQYQLFNFNAMEVVNVRPVDQLNFVGFTKNGVVAGTPEIGDNITPEPVQQAFTAYDKAIFADSIRYEFSQREIKDSVFSIESEMLRDIPGAMLKMKDDKITTVLNAMASLGDISPDWDAISGNFYSADAGADIEADDLALNSLGGATHFIAPADVIRLYKRNIQSAIAGVPPQSSAPAGQRSGQLALNDTITYIVNNTVTANTGIVINKPSWADMFQGPTISVEYQNRMTSGQLKGSILFDFNGLQTKLASAARKHNGYT